MSSVTTSTKIRIWGWTLSIFLLVTYLLCVGFGLLFPGRFHLLGAWASLLPGFEWPTWPSFLAGAVGSFLFGWYGAVILVPLYNYFSRKAG